MQRDGEGSARDPLLHGAAGSEVRGIGPGALGFRVADGSPPTVLSSHASLCKASSADATACSWGTYRLIPPAVLMAAAGLGSVFVVSASIVMFTVSKNGPQRESSL